MQIVELADGVRVAVSKAHDEIAVGQRRHFERRVRSVERLGKVHDVF
jgi:hypothetical protein